MYNLIFSDRALKNLKAIRVKDARKIVQSLERLSEDPNGSSNVKRLTNHPLAVYRLQVGSYRVLFDKDEKFRILEVIDVGHRKSIY